ncbi:MAG: PKD domain-containing protein [Acidobacteria bacterium]|nr:PKD domain-containing protein [Acidobacteriota bacterium]
MNSRCVRVLAAVFIFFLFGCAAFAQQEGKKRRTAASLDGTTGLFKVWDAETLRAGETNFTFGYDQFNRDPGQLEIGRAVAGVAVGIVDRFEGFLSYDVQRRIEADNILAYRRTPGSLPIPATTPTGVTYFSQTAPFMDVPVATGRSDVHLGLKFNLLSERGGKPLSLALTGFGTIPGHRSSVGLARGLSNGSYSGGFGMLFSKTAGDFARFHLNAGTQFLTEPSVNGSGAELADFQNEFLYRGGVEFPAYKPYRIIAEISGTEYYGSGSANLNPSSPMDIIIGARVFPARWLSLGAGYQASVRHVDDDPAIGALGANYHGFVVQGTIGIRKNDPPTVTCNAAKSTILQTESTTLRASAVDPDGDNLTYSWTSTGGKVTGNNDTATFDATDVAPGKYTVTVTVSDGKHDVTCSTEITVLKKNYPPTASVEPATFDVTQGDTVNLRCAATDANNDPLTYSWSVNGQSLAATGPQISFGSEGRTPGEYTVTCTVSDGEATATASAKGNVRERIIPNKPPTIECLTTTMDVASGSTIELRARATDPEGAPLTYTWTSTGGTVSGTGETATFNAAGVRAGSYTVTATVDDGKDKASCSMTVNVSERLSVTKEKCGFFAPGGTRVDNCAKAILDDLAVRMKNDPTLHANVIGYTDSRERSKTLGERRAKAMVAYLEKQGVESSRMTITNGGQNNPVGDNKTAAGRRLNRRVEIELTVR